MGKTIAEKVLGRASGKDVRTGDFVTANLDTVMVNTWLPSIYRSFIDAGFEGIPKIWDKEKVVVAPGHQGIVTSVENAAHGDEIRKIVKEYSLPNFSDEQGIFHEVMPEKGYARPGMLIAGTDSHTLAYGAVNCASTSVGYVEMGYVLATGQLWFRVPETIKITVKGALTEPVMGIDVILKLLGEYSAEMAQYKSVEWDGPVLDRMSINERMTMSTMSTEMGAKFGICKGDAKTEAYVRARTDKPFKITNGDPDAGYSQHIEVDASELEPQIACPDTLENVKPISEVEGIEVQHAFLGSCAQGRLEDFEAAAKVLRGRKVRTGVELVASPASPEQALMMVKSGVAEAIMEAGGKFTHATCGPCTAILGVLAAQEHCITATTRNFKGRMGSPDAKIWLGSPATVAASAVTGVITDPRKFLGD